MDRSLRAAYSMRAYVTRGTVLGAVALGVAGAVCGSIGYELQSPKTYDVWFHALNGGLTAAVAGAILGGMTGAICARVRRSRANRLGEHK